MYICIYIYICICILWFCPPPSSPPRPPHGIPPPQPPQTLCTLGGSDGRTLKNSKLQLCSRNPLRTFRRSTSNNSVLLFASCSLRDHQKLNPSKVEPSADFRRVDLKQPVFVLMFFRLAQLSKGDTFADMRSVYLISIVADQEIHSGRIECLGHSVRLNLHVWRAKQLV